MRATQNERDNVELITKAILYIVTCAMVAQPPEVRTELCAGYQLDQRLQAFYGFYFMVLS